MVRHPCRLVIKSIFRDRNVPSLWNIACSKYPLTDGFRNREWDKSNVWIAFEGDWAGSGGVSVCLRFGIGDAGEGLELVQFFCVRSVVWDVIHAGRGFT